MSFASDMVALLKTALQTNVGVSSIRHPNGATITYQSREEMLSALRQFESEVAKDAASVTQWGFQKSRLGSTRDTSDD